MDCPNTSSEQQPALASEQDQALAVFNHAGEEIRFFKSQQWRVTNYALLAYAALAAAPDLVSTGARAAVPEWTAILKVAANLFCAGAAILAAWFALRVLRSLDQALKKEGDRMSAARSKLPLVQQIHDDFKPQEPRGVTGVLRAALWLGVLLVILISLSRIPRVVACLTAGP